MQDPNSSDIISLEEKLDINQEEEIINNKDETINDKDETVIYGNSMQFDIDPISKNVNVVYYKGDDPTNTEYNKIESVKYKNNLFAYLFSVSTFLLTCAIVSTLYLLFVKKRKIENIKEISNKSSLSIEEVIDNELLNQKDGSKNTTKSENKKDPNEIVIEERVYDRKSMIDRINKLKENAADYTPGFYSTE